MINKRFIILISSIFAVVILTAISLWLLFKSPETTPVASEQPEQEEIASEPITPLKETDFIVFKLSDSPVVSPSIINDSVRFYSKQSGYLHETSFDGKSQKTVTNFSVPNIITGIWSFDKSKVINIYKENDIIKKALYDISSKKVSPLDSRIRFINFSTSQNKIVYQFIDEQLSINKISTSDPDGLNWKNIQNIRMENIRLYWPKDNLIAILTAPSGLVKGSLLTTDPSNGGSLIKLITESFGLTIKYSDDGNFLLYSQTDQNGHSPKLYLIKNGNIAAQELNLNTLSDKCTFSKNNNIYCAIPSIINGSLILPDDFYKDVANFSDSIFKIDTNNNRSFSIMDSSYLKDLGYNFNMSDLLVSPNEDYLVFINKNDGLLYSVKVK